MTGTKGTDEAFTHLCHHLSLTRQGKVQGAVDGLVLTVLAFDPEVGNGDANDVAEAISTYFSVDLPVGEVRRAIETHLRAGRLLPAPKGGGIVPAAKAQADFEARVAEATALEQTVRREWLLEVAATYHGLDAEALWKGLEAYLALLIQMCGKVELRAAS